MRAALLTAFAGHPTRALLAALAVLTAWRLIALLVAAPPLHFDEAQYWWWSQAPDWGYYSKPPLIAWGIAASTAWFGDAMWAVRLPTLLCYPVAAWFVYLTAARLYDEHTALLAGLAYATLPVVSFYSWAATTDAWLVLCWAVGTHALVRALEEDRWRDWLVLGAALGVGLLAKYAMAVFGASVAAYLFLHQRPRLRGAKALAAGALGVALLLPNLAWNARHDFQTLRHTAEISHLDRELFNLGPMLEWLASQFAVFGPVLASALVVLLVQRWRERRRARAEGRAVIEPGPAGIADPVALLLWLGLPMIALILAQSFLARAFANWAQAAYVPLSIAVVAALLAHGRMRLLVASFALHLVFAAVVYHHMPVLAAFGVEPPRKADLTLRMRAWPEAGARVAELLAARPGAALVTDEREVSAELLYYARAARPELAVINPNRIISDHFRLKHDLAASSAERFLIVTRRLNGKEFAPYFSSLRALPPIQVQVRSDQLVEFRVFEARGFLGY